MRHLASIQEVKSIEPIEDADKIELVHVLGWQCVANKGDFNVGDKCIYFEIDSFLPIKEEFEFLRRSSYRNNEFMGEGFRIKTIKLRGQLSQGLIIPVSAELQDKNVGDDVTDILGVRKWELPEMASDIGIIVGERPEFIKKTDETRIQSNPALLEEFRGLDYYITTKCDGSSCSIGINENGEFFLTSHVCTLKNIPNTSAFVDFVNAHGYEEKLRKYMEINGLTSVVIQGEWCGGGINKNRLHLKEPHWYIFTVDENRKRVTFDELRKVIQFIGGEMVMLDEEGTDLPSKYPTVEALLEKANGTYPNGGIREGIVIRPKTPVYSKLLDTTLSMKVVSNKYLLKNDE